MRERVGRNLGAIYTPSEFAQLLTSWAIQHATDSVLDVGTGKGVFVFTAYQRLCELGADPTNAQSQIYGAEIDHSAYTCFTEQAAQEGLQFPNVYRSDFFDLDFPAIDSVIGNPPYVRRTYIDDIDQIRRKLADQGLLEKELDLSRMTDLYVYCLLGALGKLKPGGRVGVIVADPWLTMGYGNALKKYLHQYFEIHSLISLDRRVFDNAQVKPVLVLATKKEEIDGNHTVSFIRVRNGLATAKLGELLHLPEIRLPDVTVAQVKSSELKVNRPWSIHFKAPELYELIATHSLMAPVANLAATRIGLQTLAKEFFVLTPEQARAHQIEFEYLAPLAQSSRLFNAPTIQGDDEALFYLFYCSKEKGELQGSGVLNYILAGESAEVSVRGKNKTVNGYDKKERIRRAHRKNWYDLKTDLERRGRAAILIPRLIYRNYTVVWNKARFVPGELFIEFIPHPLSTIETEVYLAILTSSLTEIMLRIHAQIYGGGTYNINPGEIKKVPIVNPTLLAKDDLEALKQAYQQYLADPSHNRDVINKTLFKILKIEATTQYQFAELLADLIHMATSAKKSGKDAID